jgi:hypothetical protein
VFFSHGLVLAIFTAMALVAAIALWRVGATADRPRLLAAAAWLGVMLVLAKSLGALLLGLVIAPLAALAGARLQMLAAATVAAVVLLYPALRGADVVPTRAIMSWVEANAPDRAGSLGLRLRNEDMLLARAAERPWFGWGPGRSRVHDPETGQDISTTDGRWVIVIGVAGWIGYAAEFGLLVLPMLALARRRGPGMPSAATRGLCLVLCVNLLDLLPNSSLTPVTWLMAGALAGMVERRP